MKNFGEDLLFANLFNDDPNDALNDAIGANVLFPDDELLRRGYIVSQSYTHFDKVDLDDGFDVDVNAIGNVTFTIRDKLDDKKD